MRVCSPIPLSCDYCFTSELHYATIMYVLAGLTPGDTYHLWITDKFGNQYFEEIIAEVDGSIPIDTANYPDGMFNPLAGWFDLFVTSDSGGNAVVPMIFDSVEYNCLKFSTSCENGFTPADLTRLVGWYMSDTGTILIGSDVDIWMDQSGEGNDLVAVSAIRRPTLTTNELNGYPGIVFSSDDLLKTAPFTLNQPTTVYVVYKKITNPRGYVFDGAVDSSGALIHELNDDLFISSGALTMPVVPSGLGTFNLVTSVFESNNGLLQRDDETESTGNPGLLNMGGFTVGGPAVSYGFFCNMSVVEIIVTASHAGLLDRSNIKQYVSDKYGIS